MLLTLLSLEPVINTAVVFFSKNLFDDNNLFINVNKNNYRLGKSVIIQFGHESLQYCAQNIRSLVKIFKNIKSSKYCFIVLLLQIITGQM